MREDYPYTIGGWAAAMVVDAGFQPLLLLCIPIMNWERHDPMCHFGLEKKPTYK